MKKTTVCRIRSGRRRTALHIYLPPACPTGGTLLIVLFRVIIVANGSAATVFYRSGRPEDYVICAGRGTCHALAIGLQPRLVIGDFDSLDGAMRRQLAGRQVKFLCYPCEKDQSDLELALERAMALRPREIMVFCALGGPRLEQILANIFLLVLPLEAGIPAAIVDERHEVG